MIGSFGQALFENPHLACAKPIGKGKDRAVALVEWWLEKSGSPLGPKLDDYDATLCRGMHPTHGAAHARDRAPWEFARPTVPLKHRLPRKANSEKKPRLWKEDARRRFGGLDDLDAPDEGCEIRRGGNDPNPHGRIPSRPRQQRKARNEFLQFLETVRGLDRRDHRAELVDRAKGGIDEGPIRRDRRPPRPRLPQLSILRTVFSPIKVRRGDSPKRQRSPVYSKLARIPRSPDGWRRVQFRSRLDRRMGEPRVP